MLASPQANRWASRRPRVIVADLKNNTDDENLRVSDIYDGIQERLLNSGVVRVVSKQSTNFNHIVHSYVTSTRQRGEGGNELVFYTLTLKLYDVSGELVGQWSDRTAFARQKKPFF